jgi:hypothetical protein
MGWQPRTDGGVEAVAAERAGTQAGTFLTEAVHSEVDSAVLDPVEVLMDPHAPGMAVYAMAAVQGPLRAYLATAWGRAEHVASRHIVSYLGIDLAREALRSTRAERLAGQGSERRYEPIGIFTPDPAGSES